MRPVFQWVVPIAVLGSVVCIAMTLLQYIKANRLGVPGGYLSLALGSLGVGLCAGAATYIISSRIVPSTLATAGSISLITAGVLLFTLIRAFGT